MRLISLFFLILLLQQSYAAVLNVPQDYSSIQTAIESAQNGDTVLVAQGRYYENIIFRGKNIVVASNYIFSNDPLDIELTIIDGSQPVYPDSASCVRIVSNESSAAQLIGFTLTGGKGTKWLDEHGAGLYREGGGILITLASPVIKSNIIIFNEATNITGVSSAGGGGIRVGDGNPIIEGNYIAYNKGRYGAGLVLNYTGAVVRNNIFYKNSGGEDYGGGGIWALLAGPAPKIITNNTIVGNASSPKGGGGIYVWSTSLILNNNIIYNNTGGPSYPNIRLVSGGSVSAEYNLIQGGYTGTGNFSADPLLLSSFALDPSSPCIDAGNPDSVYNDIADPQNPGFAKLPSLGTTRNDVGAYGGPYLINYSQIINDAGESSEVQPGDFSLYQNYPNPFNPNTAIKYSVAHLTHVTIRVFDILGNEIETLVNEEKDQGVYTINFNANNLASGLYLYCIQAGSFVETRKMILIK